MIKKHLIAVFVNSGTKETPNWTRIKKSTELTLSMNPETEDVDYISDESPSTELSEYKPQIEQPLKMIKDEPDFEYFWDLFYSMAVGNDARTQYLIVFMFDKVGEGSDAAYRAWSGDCIVSFNELNAVDSELSFDLMFGGTVQKGTATVTGTAPDYKPAFVPAVDALSFSPSSDM